MIKPNPYVALRDSNYIAKGRQQFVYEHPSDPSALIKITMLEKLASEEPFRTRASAAATLRPFLREFKEYILLKARNQSPNTLLPACEVRGIVQTDIGLGLVYQKIADPDGSLSPTIHDLIEAASLKSHHRDEFNHFFQSLIDNHFVVNSSNPRNIVYQTNADGSGQFLYIDSTGVKQHIPLRRWFKSLNTRKLKNVRESLLAEMKFTDDNSHQSSKATQTPRPLIKLSNQKRITDGKRQNIYEHPDDPTTLIKITKPKTFDSNGNLKERRFSDRFRPATAFRSFLLEFNEFLLLKARNQSPNPALPLCQIRGIAQTDIGLGLLYERISNPDGTLAQPLKQLITSGNIAQQHLDEIEVFFQNQINNHVVVGNFNPLNIVYQINADGSGRFVWIDSFGSKQFIPIRSWFKSQNARKIRKIRALHVGNMQAALKRQPTADK